MSHIVFIISLLLCITNFTLSLDQEDSHKSLNDAIFQRQITEKIDAFNEEDVEEMESVFADSSTKAQIIVQHLTDPNYLPLSKDFRAAYFIGETKSDKNTMAYTIAYKMLKEGWDYKVISATSILEKNCDKLSLALHMDLNNIVEKNKPTIIILEDLDQLFEYSHLKYRDMEIASKALCTFLDKQKGNKNFFLIGTITCATHLPNSLKDEMLFNIVKFPLINDTPTKNRILRKYLTVSGADIDQEITDDFLNEELYKMNSCSRNDLKKMAREILMINKMIGILDPSLFEKETPDLSMIHKRSIEAAIYSYEHSKTALSTKC